MGRGAGRHCAVEVGVMVKPREGVALAVSVPVPVSLGGAPTEVVLVGVALREAEAELLNETGVTLGLGVGST